MRFGFPILMRLYFNKIQRDMHKQFYGKIYGSKSTQVKQDEEFTDYEEIK
jgi:hypothetical protein